MKVFGNQHSHVHISPSILVRTRSEDTARCREFADRTRDTQCGNVHYEGQFHGTMNRCEQVLHTCVESIEPIALSSMLRACSRLMGMTCHCNSDRCQRNWLKIQIERSRTTDIHVQTWNLQSTAACASVCTDLPFTCKRDHILFTFVFLS
jgi:hypothetical protein